MLCSNRGYFSTTLPHLLVLLLCLVRVFPLHNLKFHTRGIHRFLSSPLRALPNERRNTQTYVNFELEQFFETAQFLDIYKSLDSEIEGVYAIENITEAIQIVEASLDVYNDVKKEFDKYGSVAAHGVRIQTFRAGPSDMLEAYRDELVRQAQPVRPSVNMINLGPVHKPPDSDRVSNQTLDNEPSIISPFVEAGPAAEAAVAGRNGKEFSSSISTTLELTVANVDKVLDGIRPYLIADGGNVAVVEVDDYDRSIKLALQGACGSCPSSTTTMKLGVERVLKENFINLGAITAVDPFEDESPTLTMLKEVGDNLGKIMPAVKAMGGEVQIKDVSAEDGAVFVSFSGPEKLKKGVERVLTDSRLVKSVHFHDQIND